MKVTERFYTGDGKPADYQKILRRVRKQKKLNYGYVISLPVSGIGLLEMYPSNVAVQDYPNHEMTLVGAAIDKEEATELVIKILQDCLEQTGDLNLTDFFFPKGGCL